ncbi:MAG: LamG-like jellyroll fold domain-containing protein [Acidobacteriaceae bacterium]
MNGRKVLLGVCTAMVLVNAPVPGIIQTQPAARSTDVSWSFDEGSDETLNASLAENGDHLQGFWRRVPGVRGNALEFDGYMTGIWRSAADIPRLGDAFTVSAWVALDNYPWNWVPIVDQSEFQQVGYSVAIDAFGHVGFGAAVNGMWRQLTTEEELPLKKWVHVTAVFSSDSGQRFNQRKTRC